MGERLVLRPFTTRGNDGLEPFLHMASLPLDTILIQVFPEFLESPFETIDSRGSFVLQLVEHVAPHVFNGGVEVRGLSRPVTLRPGGVGWGVCQGQDSAYVLHG